MDSKKIISQVVDYQKELFDHSFDMIAVFQDQRNRIINRAVEKNTLFPDSGKKLYASWLNYFEQNRDNCKEYVDKNFDRMKEFFGDHPSSSSKGESDTRSE